MTDATSRRLEPVDRQQAPVRRLGPYLLEAEVGRGAFGVVYRAAAPGGGPVALKTVLAADPDVARSIRREVHALSRLRHPGVVRIVDAGEDAGQPWYAMELVPGATLREHVRSFWEPLGARPQIPAPAVEGVAALLARIADALAHLHGEGIVHRDLKPRNVVVRDDGRPCIVDFGLALASRPDGRDALERPGSSGTLAFMAPEQLLGGAVDARADLFALGAMAYLLLCGELPFPTVEALLDPDARPVPLASRIAGLAEDVSHLVDRLLRRSPRERPGHAVDVADVLRRTGRLAREAGPEPRPYLYRPSLAGRDDLLARLSAFVRGTREGRGAMVLLAGESGIGKTRLALELARAAEAARFRVVTGECRTPREGEGGALHPLRDLLDAIVAACRESPEATARLLGDRRSVLPFLPGAGTPAPPGPDGGDLPRAEARQRLISELARVIAAFAESAPVVVLLDDVQWADGLTRDLLAVLAADAPAGLCVIGTYRSDDARGGLGSLGDAARVVDLDPLPPDAVGLVVGDMLATRDPDPDLVAFLSSRSDGNPFFVGEYLRASLDAGLLARDPRGGFRLAAAAGRDAYAGLPVPVGLRAIVKERLAGLSPSARSLGEAVAVLGRDATEALVRRLAPMPESDYLDGSRELLVKQVLEAARPGSFRFVHGQLRDAGYDALPAERRRVLHRTAAEALVLEGRGEDAALGHHWENAGEPERAFPLYLSAARSAAERYALDDAASLYDGYLRLAPASAERAVARLALAEGVLAIAGRIEAALAGALQCVDEARSLGDRVLEGRALRVVAAMRSVLGRMAEAREAYGEALAIHRELGDRLGEGMTERYLGILDVQSGNLAEAHRRFSTALAVFRDIGDGGNEALALGNVATVLKSQSRPHEALPLFEQALALHARHGDRRFGAIDGLNLAGALEKVGRVAEAIARYEEAGRVLRELGDRRFEAICITNLALALEGTGRLPEAGTLLERAIRLFGEVGDRRSGAIAGNGLAGVRRQQGRRDEAAALYAEQLATVRAIGDVRMEAVVLTGLANATLDGGDAPRAAELAREAAERARQVGLPDQEVHALVTIGDAELACARTAAARDASRRSLQIAEGIGEPRLLGIALRERASIERRSSGDGALIASLLERAEPILAQASARLDLALCIVEQGQAALDAGRDASAFLARAAELAEEVSASTGSYLDRALNELRARVDAAGRSGTGTGSGSGGSARPGRT